MDSFTRLERLADVLQFEVPPSHRGALSGRAVTLAKRGVLRSLRPLHVELLRGQHRFNVELVSTLAEWRSAQGMPTRVFCERASQVLGSLARPEAQPLASHRRRGGAVVGALKRGYLSAIRPLVQQVFAAQYTWNQSVLELVRSAHDLASLPAPERRDRIAGLVALGDPLAQVHGLSRASAPYFRELFRRQMAFNRQATDVVAEILRVHPPQHPRPAGEYDAWIRDREAPEIRRTLADAQSLASAAKVSLVVPVCDTPETQLRECLDALFSQKPAPIEVCVADDASTAPHVARVLAAYAKANSRLRCVRLPTRSGIAKATQAALHLATGDFVGFVDHDDTLAPHALASVVLAVAARPDADVLYSDEDRLDSEGRRVRPFFKPDWSPDLLCSLNYVCHFLVVRRALLSAVGGMRDGFDGAQDYDLMLRLSERTQRIVHIPKVLYHWREAEGSTAQNVRNKPLATEAGKRALAEHLVRAGVVGAEVSDPVPTNYRIRYPLVGNPRVSIIVPFRDKPELLETLTRALLTQTQGPAFELLLVSNQSQDPRTHALLAALTDVRIRQLQWDKPFNYSAINNFAAQHAQGDVLCFLNNDVEITDPGWLKELVSWAQRPEIGIVGPKLMFPDGTLQHAGVVVGLNGFAGHPFVGMAEDAFTAMGSPNWARNVSAVTGACLVMRREVFTGVGGFDERFVVCGSDVDLCLRVRAAGLRVAYTPHARLIHDESSTRRADRVPEGDFSHSVSAYGRYLEQGDPYYNPNLSLRATDGALREDDRPGLSLARELLSEFEKARAAPKAARQELNANWDASPADIEAVRAQNARELPALRRQGRVQRVAWLIPAFRQPYGGIHTIFRFGELLGTRHGVQSDYLVYDRPDASASELEARASWLFPTLAGKIRVVGPQEWRSLPEVDVAVATAWTSAYAALRYQNAKVRAYFVQDFEPLFHPAGAQYGLAEETYRMGFWGIFNTQGLYEFVTRQYGMEGTWFEPAVDASVFHADRSLRQGPVRVFFYGRPAVERNGFQLGIAALKRLKQQFGERIDIISAGADWRPSEFGMEGVVENLGVLPYEKTGELYRSCDVGVCFMFTKHPSYLPLEMMACGVAVVTNQNPANAWLFENGKNGLEAMPTPQGVAEAVAHLVENPTLRQGLARQGQLRVSQNTWDGQVDNVYAQLTRGPSASVEKR
ncbi:MAG: glycosyltransferase [Myxococcaceae bacterium]